MTSVHHLPLATLRPGNWYVDREKLERIREVWRRGGQGALPPVLVAEIDGELSVIDGNTRCLAAFENGATGIAAEIQEIDEIEGSRALYEHIHRAGPGRGISSVADLADRIVEPDEHRARWIGYCEAWLAEEEGNSC